jgi:hypothetical protein
MSYVTDYLGFSKYYFRHLISTIIKIGKLDHSQDIILDYGAGLGILKKLLGSDRVVNFDVIKDFSDIEDWKSVHFDVLVANQVFYLFDEKMLMRFLSDLKGLNSQVKLIVGISKQGLLNKAGMHFFGKKNAHKGSKLLPRDELNILNKYCTIINKKNVLWLADVYLMVFRGPNDFIK